MIPCSMCGKDSGWSEELFNSPLFGNPEIPKCDPCLEQAMKEDREENGSPNLTKFHQQPIESLIRPLYMDTVINRLPREAQTIWQSMQHWSPNQGKGIYMLGNTRMGKTRLLTLLLRKLHQDGHVFKIFYAGEFHAELGAAKRSSHYHSWRDEVVNIPILAIDDLFAEKITPTIEAGLFEVINQRMERKLPMLCTTQVRKSDAVARFEDGLRGKALLARFAETCTPYIFNNDVMQEKLAV